MKTRHLHDMRITFPDGGLGQPVFVCRCGLQATDSTSALALDGQPLTPAEYNLIYLSHYGTFGEQFMRERTTPWQRFLRWWREEMRCTHHRGCGGKLEETGRHCDWQYIRIFYRCIKCNDEISHRIVT